MAQVEYSASLLVPAKYVYNGPQGSAVYAIVNTITGQRYIGSTGPLSWRWKAHLAQLRRGKHHAKRLQKAWDTYGREAFTFVILERPEDDSQLCKIEQRYLDECEPAYNTALTVTRA